MATHKCEDADQETESHHPLVKRIISQKGPFMFQDHKFEESLLPRKKRSVRQWPDGSKYIGEWGL
jgi:hypothetical protein